MNGEFIPKFYQTSSWLGNVWHFVVFYAKNLFIVFQAKTAFFPENNVLFTPVSYALFSLFLLGSASFILTRDERRRCLGLFFGGSNFSVVGYDGRRAFNF
jgi:hypothetical protein